MKKIIFMGTPGFSVPILKALFESEYEVVAVVTQPDRPVGRKRTLTPPPVKELALQYHVPVFQPEKISGSHEMTELINLEADLIVTAAYGQFLPTKLLNAPKYRAINVHASLLPKYRGGAPVHYAIIEGEKETGVSIMYMEKKMDAGDVLAQRSIPIEAEDDVQSMFDKLSLLGRDLLMETLPNLFAGNIHPIPQDESKVTFSPNITREQERIDWQQSAPQIANKIRGMRPWPVAHALFEGARCKMWAAVPTELTSESAPGSIIKWDKQGIYVACGNNTVLQVTELQPAGKKRMTVTDFLNGNDMEAIAEIGFD
ncbi:methionyl-tRNA formyltransferase [Jeotgalibaca sp. A122]|uniref:methionyl-tRNA formyltransferase n=1 Tax=Jeotgalibaca sp. A122 TaxID=3457322 RepID=UPI003FD6A6A3